ncbi:hypothetical protein K493DRAFT_233166 [Basidiobolus meristosporus CBS 931.73]|uniref:Cleavage and polyadenylation specificity factor subunit 2 n=1 Tax=Basidiobolus meristosporus CBS 931.73 TaxID=1314790 RepID=A0A1Y1XUU5_9FUNG|nr:hypothetical protein K493DRAFT_233166 [Basidiobolus meristosporus CBS 931.73]|eukprot:ORX89542.1 hypothetical protein K493DRAFT_233166 [Basidiobolus meristosporus CBS 931.73]
MTSYIKFTAISGSHSEAALCYLLEVDDVKILLDCGWYDPFNLDELKHLKRVAKQIDVVLLSHPDLAHLGAFPYAYSKLGLSCPVYATLPTQNMGRMCMLDVALSKKNATEFDLFTVEEIDTAFDKITILRYSQPTGLSGMPKGILITAYAAGHTIGGTIWKIKKDTDEIVYAVDYNHKKERHLDGTVLHANGVVLESLFRPSVLITDAYNSLAVHAARKYRENALFESIISTLRNGGNVLVPVDSSSRVLEIAYVLDHLWNSQRLSFPLLFYTHKSYRTTQFAKSMLEWMSDSITKQFESARENPFDLKNVRLCHKQSDLAKHHGPKIILASCISMETGYSRDLLVEWGADPKNTVILTSRGPPNTLARKLYEEWESVAHSRPGTVVPPVHFDLQLQLNITKKVPLEGAELLEHTASERTRLEREAAQAALIARSKTIIEEDESDESESDVDDVDMEQLLHDQFDLYLKDATKSGGFFKQTQSYRMFPYIERKKRFDDYGEVIQPEKFMKDFDLDQLMNQSMAVDENAEVRRPDPFAGHLKTAHHMDIDKEEQTTEPSIPTKYVAETENLHMTCKVVYIDLEGLSDGRSIKTILPQVNPRKLIIIHGTEEATKDLMNSCLQVDEMTKEIFAPRVGEMINVSSATNIYQVKLTDSLVSSLNFSKLDDYELAHITGKIHYSEDSSTPTLDVLPIEEQQGWHPPLFVGDVRLTELKRVLQNEGIVAEFKGDGVLVCDDHVAIRKTSAGQIVVDGCLSANYYKIRSLVYKQVAIV